MRSKGFIIAEEANKVVASFGKTDDLRPVSNVLLHQLGHEFYVAHTLKDLAEKRYQEARTALLQQTTEPEVFRDDTMIITCTKRKGALRLNKAKLASLISKEFNADIEKVLGLIEEAHTEGAPSYSYQVAM